MTMRDLENWQGCRRPEGFQVTGTHVALEPYDTTRHAAALWKALGGTSGINDRLRYFTTPDFAGKDEFAAWLDHSQGSNVTEVFRDVRTGAVVGMASYMRIDEQNGVVEVGSVAHGDAMARQPAATEVHYLMARHVFDDLGYRRYEWKCHNDNAPSKRTAERLGFTFEGIFRQHMVSKGANRDTAWYAMTDSEWPVIRAAMEAWLDPENFDRDGRQVRKLEDLRAALAGSERTVA